MQNVRHAQMGRRLLKTPNHAFEFDIKKNEEKNIFDLFIKVL
jgi:hypothetical protein